MSTGRALRPTPAEFRAWRDTDPPVCAFSTRAARLMPKCGPPVLVRDVGLLGRPRPLGTRVEPLCLLHASGRFVEVGIGALCTAAEHRARERVCAAHPDEYTDALEDEANGVVAQVLSSLPPELRELVAAGAAAHR